MLFAVPPTVHVAVDTLQWLIIAWFAVEYIVAGLLAPAKRAFLLNPWRVLDVLTILIPLTSLLPNVSGAVMSSPVLRLVRLARLVTLGVRVSGVAVRQRVSRGEEPTVPASRQIKRMGDARGISPRAASWEDLLRGLGSSQGEWFHVSNPSAEDLAEMGKAAGLAGGFLENHLLSTSYPHVATVRGGNLVLTPHLIRAIRPLTDLRALIELTRFIRAGRFTSCTRTPPRPVSSAASRPASPAPRSSSIRCTGSSSTTTRTGT